MTQIVRWYRSNGPLADTGPGDGDPVVGERLGGQVYGHPDRTDGSWIWTGIILEVHADRVVTETRGGESRTYHLGRRG